MTYRPLTAAALALAALALSACDERHEMAANPKVCAVFKPATTTTTATNATTTTPIIPAAETVAPVDDCVRKWAYALAPSRDAAGTVAEAVASACTAQLARWNQQALSQPGSDVEAASLTTGQPTTPLAEHSAYTTAHALLYVVQARAGHCAPPPMTNGVPDGLS